MKETVSVCQFYEFRKYIFWQAENRIAKAGNKIIYSNSFAVNNDIYIYIWKLPINMPILQILTKSVYMKI